MTDCQALIVDRIRQQGPLTVADYMALALYEPGAGYYARAAQRSGRAGDFFTSVDAGPWFGRLLAARFASWLEALGAAAPGGQGTAWDLVEVGAGNGRLSRDILDALATSAPALYDRVSVHLIERSATARGAHPDVLSAHAARLSSSSDRLPERIDGIVFANELLDAFPVHLVEGTQAGLAEVFVDATDDGRLVERLGPPSTPAFGAYLDEVGITLAPRQRAEINLDAVAWVQDAARRLTHGYLVVIDYGHEASDLYSAERPAGTLATFHRHMLDAPSDGPPGTPAWLVDPGRRDLTAHVDLTSVRRAAEAAGLSTVSVMDQTRFLLDIASEPAVLAALTESATLQDRLLLKTLLVPGGLGTTHKVMVFARQGPGTGDRGPVLPTRR